MQEEPSQVVPTRSGSFKMTAMHVAVNGASGHLCSVAVDVGASVHDLKEAIWEAGTS